MDATIEISSENAAFEGDDAIPELVRILKATIAKIEAGQTQGMCFDVNGNKCGSFGVSV